MRPESDTLWPSGGLIRPEGDTVTPGGAGWIDPRGSWGGAVHAGDRAGGGRLLENDQVVAVDDFAFVFVAELGREPAGGAAHERGNLLGVIVDQAPGD